MDSYRDLQRDKQISKAKTFLAGLQFDAALLRTMAGLESPWLNSAIALTETFIEDLEEV